MNALRRVIEQAPPGTLFTREGLLAALRAEPDHESRRRMIGTNEAAQLLGVEPRKLRRQGVRWESQQYRGIDVPIRVGRRSDAPRSDLLYDREDVLRRAHRPRLAIEDGGKGTGRVRGSVARTADRGADRASDDADAIADDLVRRHYG